MALPFIRMLPQLFVAITIDSGQLTGPGNGFSCPSNRGAVVNPVFPELIRNVQL
jgi:hypothetical protein